VFRIKGLRTYHSQCPTIDVSMAEYDVVTTGGIKTISTRAHAILFLAFVLVTELLDKPILIDISRKCCRVSPHLKLG